MSHSRTVQLLSPSTVTCSRAQVFTALAKKSATGTYRTPHESNPIPRNLIIKKSFNLLGAFAKP